MGGGGILTSAIIPPTFVGAFHIQVFFILGKLQLHPRRVNITISVPLGKHVDGLLLLSIDVHPTRRLGNQEAQEADQPREDELEPDR